MSLTMPEELAATPVLHKTSAFNGMRTQMVYSPHYFPSPWERADIIVKNVVDTGKKCNNSPENA
jgi:hypothetical protein